ncbi:MAG: transposase [Tildeniella nuda ZEHNDER 1965/U140]|jgi:REP element-mobilizing transposase RayT|nr:transposase [Tildeniella nuda ZEHNDER 1965/U140]
MTQPRRPNRVSIRLQNWDYASNAWYFVTICTRDRQLFFGDIVSETMQLSAIGEIAQQYWLELLDHFNYVSLDAYVVMPNHLHGILGIDRPSQITENVACKNDSSPVSTNYPEHYDLATAMSALSPKAGTLSVILRSYKSAVSRWCKFNGYSSFAWQNRFHEQMIRDDASLNQMRQYIANNPINWKPE